jgi:hypothetical protein
VTVDPSSATRVGRTFHFTVICAALAVGALQMYRVRGGVVTDYGADVFGTAWVYATIRLGRSVIQRGRTTSAERAASVVFVLCVLWELGQRAHLAPGRYDPYDIVTYAATAVACWLIDRLAPFTDHHPQRRTASALRESRPVDGL